MKTLTFTLALMLAGAAAPALADTCGADSSWSLGGPAFGEDASDYAAGYPQCAPQGGRCEFTGTDGVTTVLAYVAGTPRVMFRRRGLRPDETLPLGIRAADTPDQAMAWVKAAGLKGLWGQSMSAKPASVAATCDGFILQFIYDGQGRMTGVSETWLNGPYFYVDDPTLSLTPAR